MSARFDLSAWSTEALERVERALSGWVAPEQAAAPEADSGWAVLGHEAPAALREAMRYAVLDGGKRLRPLLVLAARQAIATGESPSVTAALDDAALRAACAAELIHAYSLVHDDMPCMDNDVLRRGKPTVHVRFGEAQALLAGDALQALAFELITSEQSGAPATVQSSLCRQLARAAGYDGMAGGQAIDLASIGLALSEEQLRGMHRLKTGALLCGSVMMGATCRDPARACSNAVLQGLAGYGAALGLAFQVVDDILDVTADSATLGKTAGKDAAQDKPTYVSVLGLARSQAYAQELLAQALAALDSTDLPDTRALRALADMVVNRSS
ncbi:polyprenyl synthetase family protein [Pseudorhodoferax sp. Leaf267]|uniref:polyprenyl synthetase family protein n=1 Tax=Pseudorhodoferax sp. Leaf267 TaxID=1736316 RepID=UPI0006FBBF3F|nr:farnesyl diphosphate synthase [Pseudorhodoferax sp. Leaf267]KQP23009.1 polyprenyl synthetase [Pseudorhodoferax sp. Leaf267]